MYTYGRYIYILCNIYMYILYCMYIHIYISRYGEIVSVYI
jgi:hypothetical protein